MTQDFAGRLLYPGEIRRFVLGGNSTFTLQLGDTRKTFKVKSASLDKYKNWSTGNQNKSQYFVSVLTGSDNESSYTYLGMLRREPYDGFYYYAETGKSPKNHPAGKDFKWFWTLLEQGCRVSSLVEFWHEGQCCMCGRKLTVPESIANGIGPECASKGGF